VGGEAGRNTKASVSSTSITTDKHKSPASDAIGRELRACDTSPFYSW
jgi:hypothetical protein